MEIGTVNSIDINQEMRNSYLDYAMSVIVARALPDARDGLKPVHRRILYAMYDMGLRPNQPHRKSARLVGEVLGKYHPHGDSSVYDAMVRLAQESVSYTHLDVYKRQGVKNGHQEHQRIVAQRWAVVAGPGVAEVGRGVGVALLARHQQVLLDARVGVIDGHDGVCLLYTSRIPNLLGRWAWGKRANRNGGIARFTARVAMAYDDDAEKSRC